LAILFTKEYFDSLKTQLNHAYSIASTARSKGFDPSDEVEVKIAKDVAARVEGIVGPPGVAELIRTLEKGGMSREDIAFEVARKIAGGEIMAGSKEQLIEQAVRTGLGIITEGVLVAPTEGIAKVRIMNNPDGTDYVAVYYAGPIRSAGGTAAALSLVLADIARRVCKVGDYRPTETQVMRIIEEIMTYETRCVHLQYLPSEEHQKAIIQNCPVCVHGEPTEEIEVSTCRDVPGIETNRVRSGVALVICDGLALKAAKLFKITKKLNLGWTWLEKVIKVKSKEDKIEVKPDPTYLEGLVAGRPVFSHASAIGGFRLRYGRSETNSLMSRSIHPATMVLLEGFLAFGTHMKIERPGKGCVVGAHDNLEPPIVRLRSGSVIKVRTFEEAQRIKNDVSEILFLGDILTTFGDFMKSNHPLLPSGFCSEWWVLEVESKSIPVPSFTDAKSHVEFSKLHKVPLHPDYTYHYHDTSSEKLLELVKSLQNATLKIENGQIRELSMNLDKSKLILDEILIEHRVIDSKVILTGDNAYALLSSLGILTPSLTIDISPFVSNYSLDKKPLELINQFLPVYAKAPTYIGGRMGRPEKAKERKMDGSPHVLFPTGSFKNRSVSKQYRNVKIQEGIKTLNVEIIRLKCTKCNKLGFYSKCEVCGSKAQVERICNKCGTTGSMEEHCDFRTSMYDWRPIEIISLFEQVRSKLGFTPEEVKGVKGLTNVTRIPERLEKGFLRAKHDVYIFRDGTSRFDATDIPLTHFKPSEIGLTLEKAKELGYDHDYLGKPLVSDEQIIPLKHQDIVLADAGAEYFLKVAAFIDDMLLNLYNMPSFYNLKNRFDLIGHLCVGLSPHTSAGVLCRIIGFTRSTVGYGHPYFHTAKRRNCDGDEDCVMLLMDALINFSKQYLSETRGGTMDAPLVLSTEINPKEVDDEAHEIEYVQKYPLEFYQMAQKICPPSAVKLKTVKDVLGTEAQYELPLTHPGASAHHGIIRTKYVELDSIPEKLKIQFALQERLKMVDKRDAAEKLILSHFIPDLYGNLRAYSRQTFRCVNCNNIERRPPLIGKCGKCGGNLLLTINKGGIKKYLETSAQVISRYSLPDYLRQRILLVQREIESIFEDDRIKQTDLSSFL
jgi:DNA polymerase II large subunit